MTCREVQELIVETLSGTTPPELRRMVEAHLASCAACRAEAAAAEEVARTLRRLPEASLREGHWDAFMARLDARLAAEQRRPWNALRRWLRHPRHAWSAAAATAVLLVALGTAVFAPALPPGPPGHAPVPSAASVREFISPEVVAGMPGLDASLAVWRAGLGAGDLDDLTGER